MKKLLLVILILIQYAMVVCSAMFAYYLIGLIGNLNPCGSILLMGIVFFTIILMQDIFLFLPARKLIIDRIK